MSSTTVIYNIVAKDRASRTLDNVGKSGNRLTSALGKVGKVAGTAGVAIAGAAATGAAAAITLGIKTAAALEQAQIGFTTLIGSGRKAEKFLADLKKFAAGTPFELPGLIESSRTLMGVGLDAKKVIPLLTAFGDTAGAVGVGQEAFQRVMVATSQAISAGKFAAGDLNQIMNNGIPIWKILADATGKPVPKLRELASQGKLLTKDVLPLLQKQMNKDYGGAMAKQSKTLVGLWSTLKDTVQLALADAIQPMVPLLRTAIPKAAKLAGDGIKGFSRAIETAFTFGGKTKTVIDQFLAGWRGGVRATKNEAGKTKLESFVPKTAAEKAGASLRRALTGGLEGMFEELDTWLGKLNKWLAKQDWVKIGETVGTKTANAIAASAKVAAAVTSAFVMVMLKVDWNMVAGAVVAGFILGFISSLNEAQNKLYFKFKDVAGQVLQGFWDGFNNKWVDLVARIVFLPYYLVRKFKEAFGIKSPSKVFASIGRNLVQGLINGITGKVEAAVEKGRALAARVRAVFKGAPTWLLEKGRAFVNGLRNGVTERANAAVDKAKDLRDRARRVFDKAGAWLVGPGRNLVQGLKNGMNDRMSGIKTWLRAHVWSPIVKGVKALFGIHSPSTVFQGFGRDMIRGLTKGLIRNDPKGFVSKVFGGTSKAAAKALGWLFKNGKIGWGALSQIPMKLWKKFGGIFGGGNAGAGLAFAKAQDGEPYRWGGVGPSSWDCSGIWSGIVNVLKGKNPYSRLFTTSSFSGGGVAGFVRGAPSAVQVGVVPGSHMAGTILGTNVESSGSRGVRVGGGARGASYGSRRFGFVGGGVGRKGKGGLEGAAFDLGGRARGIGHLLKKTILPERVLPPRETQVYEDLLDALNRQTRGGGGDREPAVVEFRSSGSAVDDFLMELIRKNVRIRGGNVQLVFGQGGR